MARAGARGGGGAALSLPRLLLSTLLVLLALAVAPARAEPLPYSCPPLGYGALEVLDLPHVEEERRLRRRGAISCCF